MFSSQKTQATVSKSKYLDIAFDQQPPQLQWSRSMIMEQSLNYFVSPMHTPPRRASPCDTVFQSSLPPWTRAVFQKYKLIENRQWNEWQLLRQGTNHIESIFLNLDDAIKRLPDAIGNITAVVEIFDRKGANCGCHIVDRGTTRTQPILSPVSKIRDCR